MGKMPMRERRHVDDYIAQVRKPHERKGYADPGPETKGGEYKGGPKRWTGRGPAPARHIPWPELFKHHISVIEGHYKMIDMVRKHTTEGSSNWSMICSFIDRSQEMLTATKKMSRSFVEPPGQREQVPLGSSSASMYPGYSPADHIYGEAAEDAGKVAMEAKKMGEEVKHFGGIQYKYGQAKGLKGKTLAEIQAAKEKESGALNGGTTTTSTDQSERGKSTAPQGDEADRPLFVVDTQPMDIDLPEFRKRHNSDPSTQKLKKSKTEHEGDLPNGNEEDDISAEVEAKLKEKKEKKAHKKTEKKRKRETEDSQDVVAGASQDVAVAVTDAAVEEKPKKKKKKEKRKGDEMDANVEGETKTHRRGSEDIEEEGGKGKKRRKREKGE